jgi:EpsI family protein
MNRKAAVLVALLLATILVLRIRGDRDVIVPSIPLEGLPMMIGRWYGSDLPITRDVLQVLGDGDFLNRRYHLTTGSTSSIDLLIAYFPSQRSGQTLHSPQNCLPGAGWSFESGGQLELTDAAGQRHHVSEYTVANGTSRYEVLYWYRSSGNDIANDYSAKAYLLWRSIRDRRTDGALLRIMTRVVPGEPQDAARRRAIDFAEQMDPLLSPYLPG